MWISDWKEQAETGVIILVLVVSLLQVPLSQQEIQNWIEKLIYKFQPWPNLRLTYLALRGRLPFSLFNSR